MSIELQKVARKFVLDFFLENQRAPVLEDIMRNFKLTRWDAHVLIRELAAKKRLALLPGTDRILMAHPFSAITTPFRVVVQGKEYFANCAWDSIAFHSMLSRDIHVDSFCHHCADDISIGIAKGKVSSKPETPLVFLGTPAARWWEDVIDTCSNTMVYFSSAVHRDEWLGKNPGLKGETLSIEKTVELSKIVYAQRMRLDPERPTRDELTSRFAGIGLSGDFWKM